jgi:hypothetical protein
MSCLVREPLTGRAFDGVGGALHVVDAKLLPIIHAKIEFGQVSIEMLGIDGAGKRR